MALSICSVAQDLCLLGGELLLGEDALGLQVTQLLELRDAGILTEEEFAAQKAKLLA